jgi:hypothetical protein
LKNTVTIKGSQVMTKQYAVYTLALVAGLCAAAISFFAPFFPYGVDSASYLDQARSFMARGVFEVTPFGTGDTDVVSVPDNLFPLGYPLLIVASSMLLQLPVEVIAPFLSLAALILLPVVIVFSFHRVLGLLPALWLGILVVLTPAAVRHGYIAYSDTLSLVLVIYAVNRLLVADNKPASWFWLGLLTGISYLLRNANLGLLLSISLYLLWRLIVEPENRKEKITNGFVWLGANALLIVPWLARNFLVFGKLQPYWMAPSNVSFGENIHDYLKAQLDTLLAFSDLDTLLANTPWGIFLLLMLVAVLAHQVISTWKRWQKIEQHAFFIALVYAASGAAMVIAARTKYQWGIHISARHVLSFSCFVFVALVIVFKNAALKINTRYVGLGLAITLLITRACELPKLYEYDQYHQTVMGAARQIKPDQDVVCSHLEGRFAVSNYAFVYRILCAAPVRHVFPPFQHNQFLNESLPDWAQLGAKQGIVVSLFPYIDDKESELPLSQDTVIRLKASGWQVERNEKANLILSRQANFPKP